MSVSFDTILANLEKTIEIDTGIPETDIQSALLKNIQEYMGVSVPDTTLSSGYEIKKALLTPTLTGKKLQGYCVTWLDASGNEFIDETQFSDHVVKGSWSACIADLQYKASSMGKDYVLPLLWHHVQPKDGGMIGKIVSLEEDEKGVKFTALLADVPKAKEAYELCKLGVGAASYRFAPVDVEYLPHPRKAYKTYRRIKKLVVDEISIIANHDGAANPHTNVFAKSATSYIQHTAYDAKTIQRLFNGVDDALTKLQLEAIRSRE